MIVTQDADFEQRVRLYGTPPKVIWLRCGNTSTGFIEHALRSSHRDIERFHTDPDAGCIEIY